LHADGLRDAVLLMGREAAAGLGLEFEGVALWMWLVMTLRMDAELMFLIVETKGLKTTKQLTFVTASWKVKSSIGWGVVFEMREETTSSVLLGLVTAKTVLIALLVTTRS
jgi:hypothetical protein